LFVCFQRFSQPAKKTFASITYCNRLIFTLRLILWACVVG